MYSRFTVIARAKLMQYYYRTAMYNKTPTSMVLITSKREIATLLRRARNVLDYEVCKKCRTNEDCEYCTKSDKDINVRIRNSV